MEKWSQIENFPNYTVSNNGHVQNVNTGRILKPGKNPKGYSIVSLYKDGRQCTQKVHRLVAEAFCDGYRKELQINHKDGNKNNNTATNLEWCDGSSNIQHAYDTGLRKPPRMKRVKLIETGEIFDSMSECARNIGGTVSGIYDCEIGKQSSHRGYHFDFLEQGGTSE